MSKNAAIVFCLAASICALAVTVASTHDGLVEFAGAQSKIFETGKADAVLSLRSLQGSEGVYAVGPVKGLDGEITIFNSRPHITKVRGAGYTVDHSWDHDAIFLVWSNQRTWRDVAIPETVSGYLELQKFVKAQAETTGIDSSKPFPFLLAGAPKEVKWHINVDKSEGKPITQELYAKSKANYVIKGEQLDMIGFYSEHHPGVFITKYTPAIQPESGQTNALHIHFISRKVEAAGHVDDMTLGSGMVLRLPVGSPSYSTTSSQLPCGSIRKMRPHSMSVTKRLPASSNTGPSRNESPDTPSRFARAQEVSSPLRLNFSGIRVNTSVMRISGV